MACSRCGKREADAQCWASLTGSIVEYFTGGAFRSANLCLECLDTLKRCYLQAEQEKEKAMQAMACNRCKKTTVESTEGWSTLRGTGLETVVEKKYLQIDLCPECTDSFRVWYLRLQPAEAPTEVTDNEAEEARADALKALFGWVDAAESFAASGKSALTQAVRLIDAMEEV